MADDGDLIGRLRREAEKGLDLAYAIAPATPALFVGDHARLRQVLVNLLSNAVKFTERGDIFLAASAEPRGDGVYQLALTVSDTGIGIAADRLERLFQSFSQLDSIRQNSSNSRHWLAISGSLGARSRKFPAASYSSGSLRRSTSSKSTLPPRPGSPAMRAPSIHPQSDKNSRLISSGLPAKADVPAYGELP